MNQTCQIHNIQYNPEEATKGCPLCLYGKPKGFKAAHWSEERMERNRERLKNLLDKDPSDLDLFINE